MVLPPTAEADRYSDKNEAWMELETDCAKLFRSVVASNHPRRGLTRTE